MSGITGCGSAEFRSGPKISGTTLSKVIRFCSVACRTGVLYFGTGTEVVPGNPVVIPRPNSPPSSEYLLALNISSEFSNHEHEEVWQRSTKERTKEAHNAPKQEELKSTPTKIQTQRQAKHSPGRKPNVQGTDSNQSEKTLSERVLPRSLCRWPTPSRN
jgi:hypothetical protein